MKIENHIRNLKESVEIIEESIKKGIRERQRNIGFNTSAAAIDMLEIYLHKNSLIDPGFIIKHEWFNSDRKIKEKFNFNFEGKTEIIELIKKIEDRRNLFCYGKPQEENSIMDVIDNFNKLKNKFKEMGYEF